MPKISKNKLLKEIEDFIWKNLLETFRDAESEERVENIFKDLFTPSEKIIFGKRLAIHFLLTRDLSYNQISQLLKVSSATINEVRNTMRRHGRGYELVTGRSGPSQKKIDNLLQQFLDDLKISELRQKKF